MSLPTPTLPHCYRHPDRETGRSCTRCGRPACSECLAAASVGSLCPECRRSGRPDARTRVRWWNARQPALLTVVLIAANVGIFIWTTIANRTPINGPGTWGRGTWDLALAKPFLEYDGDWFRLVSAGFLHFNVLHIGMNMVLLFQLGQMLEPAIGRVRFGLLYLASLLAGSAGALILDPDSLTGGASGAVFGLMAAAVVALHQRGINPFQTGLGATFTINLLLTFTIRHISIGGHLGGAIGGALCALAVLAPGHMRVSRWATYATPVAVGAVAVALSVVVVGT